MIDDPLFLVQPEGERPFLVTLSVYVRWLNDSHYNPDLPRIIRTMRVGQSRTFGGGAAPFFTMTRLPDRQERIRRHLFRSE